MKTVLLAFVISLSSISAQAATRASCKACMDACASRNGEPGDCFFACVAKGKCSAHRPLEELFQLEDQEAFMSSEQQ